MLATTTTRHAPAGTDPQAAARPTADRPTAAHRGHDDPAHPMMGWLASGVPLTLILDLVDPDGPDSRTALALEALLGH